LRRPPRALRYGQRLNFTIEPQTLGWLERDIAGLDTISGERLRYELECVFSEQFPENILARADELGVLARLHPGLRADNWLAEKYTMARQNDATDTPRDALYLCLLFYQMEDTDAAALAEELKLARAAASVLHDMRILKNRLDGLSRPGRKPSEVHATLAGLAPAALRAAAIAGANPTASRNIEFYLDKLRYVKPGVSGRDILKMGVPPGPLVGDMLRQRLAERLDAEFTPIS